MCLQTKNSVGAAVVDPLRQLVVRERAAILLQSDDERRRLTDLTLLTNGEVRLDLGLGLLRVDALVELVGFQSELARCLLHVLVGVVRRLAVPLILGLIQIVVEIPESSLFVGAGRGARCLPRVLVARQREIDEAPTNETRGHELLADIRLGQDGETATRRAFEIAELGDLESRRLSPEDVALRLDLRQRRVDRTDLDRIVGPGRLVGQPSDPGDADQRDQQIEGAITGRLLGRLYDSGFSSSSGVHSLACHLV